MAGLHVDLKSAPDLILLGGTGITLSPELPGAEAVAVSGGLILAVGPARDIVALAGRRTEFVYCEGKCVVPGFYDAHMHLLASASKRLSVDCSPPAVSSISQIQAVIREQTELVPPGTWIRAGNYDEFQLLERRHPTRRDLDEASPDHPVKLQHRSLHACVMNSAALHIAGIDGNSAIDGIVPDVVPLTHEPTGLVYEYGDYLSARVIPPLRESDLRRGLLQVMEDLLSEGITSVQDATFNNGMCDWGRLEELRSEPGPRPRVGFMIGQKHLGEFIERKLGPGFGDEWLWVGPVKFMCTETPGSFDPPLEELKAGIRKARSHGYHVAIHAVDESTAFMAIEALADRNHRAAGAFDRIEHGSILPPFLLDRLVELQLAVVTQPSFLYHSGDRYLADLDEHVRPWLYPIGSLLARAVLVAAGSDAPVSPAKPLEGICAAVTRLSRRGSAVVQEESVSVNDALRLYTTGAARVCGELARKGSIEPGKLADMVILSEDPFSVNPNDIKDIEVEMTIVGGRVAWAKE